MTITEDFSPSRDGKRIMIEWTGIELTKHIESRMEKLCRETYEKSHSLADLLMWLSEWAQTEKL